MFLISPVRLSGRRGALLVEPQSSFDVAERLRSPGGISVEDVFSFVSGLYFRGKATYAKTFGRAPAGRENALVITAGGGLRALHASVSLEDIRRWRQASIHEDNPHFAVPLLRHAASLLDEHDGEARFVLLGSVAANKYTTPLLEVFGTRLLYPREFLGRGDMSRGSLLLRAARDVRELEYEPVSEAKRAAQ